mgnify:CR=1 FL=1
MMRKPFLEEKIEAGVEDERELLEHEPEKKAKLPALSYVRPIFFTILLTVTLIALAINGWTAIKFFMTH